MAGMFRITRNKIRHVLDSEGSCEGARSTDNRQAVDSDSSVEAEDQTEQVKAKTEYLHCKMQSRKSVQRQSGIDESESVTYGIGGHGGGSRHIDVAPIDGKWKPKFWHRHLYNIQEMRKMQPAPVDTLGCAELANPSAPPKVRRFHILISLMLSSQTKDQVTSAAMERLKSRGCSIDDIISYSQQELEKTIIPVGFYKRKAGYIKRVAEILKEEYDGEVPNSVENLCRLPGVGPKMAHLVMQVAWGQVTGISVDTHVHRIVNRLGWVPKETKNPESTQRALEEWMPRELWGSTNKLLVGFGQTICLPVSPKCGSCTNKDICPYGRMNYEKSRAK